MESPVKRLARNDRVRHGVALQAPPAQQGTALAESDAQGRSESSLSFVTDMLDMDANAASAAPAVVETPEGEEEHPSVPLAVGEASASPPAPARVHAKTPHAGLAARPELLDVLSSLCPVFRAAYVFPGPGVPARQMADAVTLMSKQVVSISDVLARDCDPLEIDHNWMRGRMGAFVSELVSSAWVSTAIYRQRLPLTRQDGAPTPPDEIERLAMCVSSALRAIEGSSYSAAAGSRVAAVVSLASLVFQMEGYRHFITRALPQVDVDLDNATRRVGAAVADEVSLAIQRLAAHVPEDLHGELASELTAQGAKFVFDARESACGEVFMALDAIRERNGTAADAVLLLNGPGMDGGVPVDRMIELMRAMFGRAVATIEFSAKAMLGGA